MGIGKGELGIGILDGIVGNWSSGAGEPRSRAGHSSVRFRGQYRGLKHWIRSFLGKPKWGAGNINEKLMTARHIITDNSQVLEQFMHHFVYHFYKQLSQNKKNTETYAQKSTTIHKQLIKYEFLA